MFLSIDFVRVTNCFYDYDYDYETWFSIVVPKWRQNSMLVGASPQTPLGELSALHTPAFKGREGKEERI